MRTTVTLEPDLAEKLKDYARRKRTSFKDALNSVLRRGLTAHDTTATRKRFAVEPHSGAFRPGIDHGALNRLVDEMDTERFVRKSRDAR